MASRKVLTELISQYVDQMLGEGRDVASYVAVFAGYRAELEPLLCLAARVRAALVAVEPRAVFREELRDRLLIAARSQRPTPARNGLLAFPPQRREVIIGAAAVGSLVSVAAIFMVVRSRSQAARQAA